MLPDRTPPSPHKVKKQLVAPPSTAALIKLKEEVPLRKSSGGKPGLWITGFAMKMITTGIWSTCG